MSRPYRLYDDETTGKNYHLIPSSIVNTTTTLNPTNKKYKKVKEPKKEYQGKPRKRYRKRFVLNPKKIERNKLKAYNEKHLSTDNKRIKPKKNPPDMVYTGKISKNMEREFNNYIDMYKANFSKLIPQTKPDDNIDLQVNNKLLKNAILVESEKYNKRIKEDEEKDKIYQDKINGRNEEIAKKTIEVNMAKAEARKFADEEAKLMKEFEKEKKTKENIIKKAKESAKKKKDILDVAEADRIRLEQQLKEIDDRKEAKKEADAEYQKKYREKIKERKKTKDEIEHGNAHLAVIGIDAVKEETKAEGRGNGMDDGLYNDEIAKIARHVIKSNVIPVIAQDEISNLPKFLKKDQKIFGGVINTNPSTSDGSGTDGHRVGHWTSFVVDARDDFPTIEWFDPLVQDKPSPQLLSTLTEIGKKMNPSKMFLFKNNKLRRQSYNSSGCGIHSLKFLEDRFKGVPWSKATGFDHYNDSVTDGEKKIKPVAKKYNKYL